MGEVAEVTGLTWWQAYLLAGMVAVSIKISRREFKVGANEIVAENRRKGLSPWVTGIHTIIGVLLAVVGWPAVMLRWIWRMFR